MGAPPQWRLFFPCRQQPVQRPIDEQVHYLPQCELTEWQWLRCFYTVDINTVNLARLRLDYAHLVTVTDLAEPQLGVIEPVTVNELWVWTRATEVYAPTVACVPYLGATPRRLIVLADSCTAYSSGLYGFFPMPIPVPTNTDNLATRPSTRVKWFNVANNQWIETRGVELYMLISGIGTTGVDVTVLVADKTPSALTHEKCVLPCRINEYGVMLLRAQDIDWTQGIQINIPPLSFFTIRIDTNLSDFAQISGIMDVANAVIGAPFSVYAAVDTSLNRTDFHTALLPFNIDGLIGLVQIMVRYSFYVTRYYVVNMSPSAKTLTVKLGGCTGALCMPTLLQYACPQQFMVPPNATVCQGCDLTLPPCTLFGGGGGGGFI